jgi:hypothetical protein
VHFASLRQFCLQNVVSPLSLRYGQPPGSVFKRHQAGLAESRKEASNADGVEPGADAEAGKRLDNRPGEEFCESPDAGAEPDAGADADPLEYKYAIKLDDKHIIHKNKSAISATLVSILYYCYNKLRRTVIWIAS